MKGVPEFLFTLKWEGVTKLFESTRYESPCISWQVLVFMVQECILEIFNYLLEVIGGFGEF